ncbi:MAG TPA: alkene reductase [Stellaceae bacterium]|nr:alkene reductase [Stellaceae bacterium]
MMGLFTPLSLPSLTLPNRILMAPMTRGRARPDDHVPTPEMATYYSMRADGGLLMTEAACVSPRARGWNGAPHIYSAEHVEGWIPVTDAVHAAGGRIYLQLWFVGRVSHPDFLDGGLPWGPSAIAPDHHVYNPASERKDCVTPHEMTLEDIATAIADFRHGARLAMAAGFDGVQLHTANGYLPDQFLRDRANRRTDGYGGTIRNRIRFLRELVEAVCSEIGGGRVAVRLSPRNTYNDIDDSDPWALFGATAEAMNDYSLSFIEVMEGLPGHFLHKPGAPVLPVMRDAFKGVMVANGGYDRDTADAAIRSGGVDAVAFGIPYLANPDLVQRFRVGAPLNGADADTFYSPGEPGYLDYPTLADGAPKGEYKALTLDEARVH